MDAVLPVYFLPNKDIALHFFMSWIIISVFQEGNMTIYGIPAGILLLHYVLC